MSWSKLESQQNKKDVKIQDVCVFCCFPPIVVRDLGEFGSKNNSSPQHLYVLSRMCYPHARGTLKPRPIHSEGKFFILEFNHVRFLPLWRCMARPNKLAWWTNLAWDSDAFISCGQERFCLLLKMHKHLCSNEFCTNLDVWSVKAASGRKWNVWICYGCSKSRPAAPPPVGKISGRAPMSCRLKPSFSEHHDFWIQNVAASRCVNHLNCLGHVSPVWWILWFLSSFTHLIGRSKWRYTCRTGRSNCRVPETMSSRFLRWHEATDKPRQSHYRLCLFGPAWALQGIEDSLWVLRKQCSEKKK